MGRLTTARRLTSRRLSSRRLARSASQPRGARRAGDARARAGERGWQRASRSSRSHTNTNGESASLRAAWPRPVPSEVEGPEPIVDVALLADVTPPRARSIDEASYRGSCSVGVTGLPRRGGCRMSRVSRPDLVEGSWLDTFPSPPTESIDVSHHEPVAEPQPTRAAAVEDPKPIASTTQTVAPISEEEGKASKSSADRRNCGTSTRSTCCRVWPSSRPLDAGRCRRGG